MTTKFINKMEILKNMVEYWKRNAEEDYKKTPISVLKYITVLEEQVELLSKKDISLNKSDISDRKEDFYCLNQNICGVGRKCEEQCLSCEKNFK